MSYGGVPSDPAGGVPPEGEYSDLYASDQPADRNAGSRTALTAVGVIMILIGIVVGISGVSGVTAPCPMGDLSDPSSGDSSFACVEGKGASGFAMVGGFALAGFGLMLLLTGQTRRVTSYMAEETAPATTTTSQAYGTGLARGLNVGGGIPLAGPPPAASAPAQEVVRIRCRSCGFLETEDARFCSNCGQQP